jgi:hypothetical protein
MRRITVAALLLATGVPAQGQSTGNNAHYGNGLYDYCQNTVDTSAYRTAFCVGFISAVVDAYDGVMFCTPSGSTYGQDVDIVKRGFAAHPEERQKPAYLLVTKYLHDVWPCPVKK